MIGSNGFNQSFDSISHEDKFFIWIYALDRKESLHRIGNTMVQLESIHRVL